jgi:hypothetical protein
MMSRLPDHDELSQIAKENPERLEEIRQHFIEKHINSATDYMQRRLRGLQFQIDSLRALHKAPMGSCIEISRMMYESLNKLRDTLNNTVADSNEPAEVQTATVLPFSRA